MARRRHILADIKEFDLNPKVAHKVHKSRLKKLEESTSTTVELKEVEAVVELAPDAIEAVVEVVEPELEPEVLVEEVEEVEEKVKPKRRRSRRKKQVEEDQS